MIPPGRDEADCALAKPAGPTDGAVKSLDQQVGQSPNGSPEISVTRSPSTSAQLVFPLAVIFAKRMLKNSYSAAICGGSFQSPTFGTGRPRFSRSVVPL